MFNHLAQARPVALGQRPGNLDATAEAIHLLPAIRRPHLLSSRHGFVRCRAVVGQAVRSFKRGHRVPLAIPAVLCVTLLTLGGCAGLGQEFASFQRGWRTGEVVAVGRADQIEEKGYSDCRRNADATELEASRYAALTYRLGQRQHWHIVKVSPDVAIAPGDMVMANVESCELPIYRLPPEPPGSS